jgi:hypothetical protein
MQGGETVEPAGLPAQVEHREKRKHSPCAACGTPGSVRVLPRPCPRRPPPMLELGTGGEAKVCVRAYAHTEHTCPSRPRPAYSPARCASHTRKLLQIGRAGVERPHQHRVVFYKANSTSHSC